jgi:hypothetical protein
MSQNPNIPIRTALISLLSALNVSAWNKRIPKNVAAPSKYALLTSQTKQPTETSKCGYEWMASINVDLYKINPYGYVDTTAIDNLEQDVINGIEDLIIPGWDLKNITLLNIQDLDADTTTQTIERRVVSYQFWLWPTV